MNMCVFIYWNVQIFHFHLCILFAPLIGPIYLHMYIRDSCRSIILVHDTPRSRGEVRICSGHKIYIDWFVCLFAVTKSSHANCICGCVSLWFITHCLLLYDAKINATQNTQLSKLKSIWFDWGKCAQFR